MRIAVSQMFWCNYLSPSEFPSRYLYLSSLNGDATRSLVAYNHPRVPVPVLAFRSRQEQIDLGWHRNGSRMTPALLVQVLLTYVQTPHSSHHRRRALRRYL